ncbi:MAG: SUF system NifU family Fe-S cluster assembly protein [Calditrichaceae bacterium]|nr:SUF system NifU family Fe-S cluster assembly protein [Calditrichaceae bacterium]MBN2709855.1 SUF system NifU family Fe-S cluster assembly protein [Calditrichaceae bacterium]
MDAEFRELYQEIILEHSKSPRNFRRMEDATHKLEGRNPLCGDQYTIYLKIENGIIADISFEGSGCAISKASASVMTSVLKGKSIAEAKKLFEQFHDIVTGVKTTGDDTDISRKIAAFSGVAEYPVRIKCATLAWHAMRNSIEGVTNSVTTEEK